MYHVDLISMNSAQTDCHFDVHAVAITFLVKSQVFGRLAGHSRCVQRGALNLNALGMIVTAQESSSHLRNALALSVRLARSAKGMILILMML